MSIMTEKDRMFKTVRIILIVLISAIMLSGCRSISPVTSEDFKTAMEDMGYKVFDITDQYSDGGYIRKCLGIGDESLHVEFFEIDTFDNAVGHYNSNKAMVMNKKRGISSESSIEGVRYSIYKLKTNNTYYLVEQVENTVILAYCPSVSASRIDDIISAIKY